MDKDQILLETISKYNGGMTHRSLIGVLSSIGGFFTTNDNKKELSNRLRKLKNNGVLKNQEYPKGDGVWYWYVNGSEMEESKESDHIVIPEDKGTTNLEETSMSKEMPNNDNEENSLPYGIVEKTITVYTTTSGSEHDNLDDAIIEAQKEHKLNIINAFFEIYELRLRGCTREQIILEWEQWRESKGSDGLLK